MLSRTHPHPLGSPQLRPLPPRALTDTFINNREFFEVPYCLDGTDAAVLWSDGLRSLLSEGDEAILRDRLRSEVMADPSGAVNGFLSHYDGNEDPEYFSDPLEQFAEALRREFPGDNHASSTAARILSMRWEWIAERGESPPKDDGPRGSYRAGAAGSLPISSERSVFDDLVV